MLLQGRYFEAVASEINPEEKSVVACFPADTGMDECCFKLEYDILILGKISLLVPQALMHLAILEASAPRLSWPSIWRHPGMSFHL